MKGIRILGDRRTELVTMDRPESKGGWVLVRSTMSAVCGSDLHIYRQTADQVGHRAQRIAGHEAVGVIEEVGSGVESLKTGDRVVVYQHFGCGRCSYCRIGEPMFCPDRQTLGNHVDGADGDLVHIPASSCLPLPDGLSDEVGALIACNLAPPSPASGSSLWTAVTCSSSSASGPWAAARPSSPQAMGQM